MKCEKDCCSKSVQRSLSIDSLNQMGHLTQGELSSSNLGINKALLMHSSCFAPKGITALDFTAIEKRVIALLASRSKSGVPITVGFFSSELLATWMDTPAFSVRSGSESDTPKSGTLRSPASFPIIDLQKLP